MSRRSEKNAYIEDPPRLETAVKQSGIAKVRFHDLRHTALTRLVLTGADLQTVRDIAGHASLKTTQRYLHSSD